ncbi:unnamed protein product [Lasius platythorax]
MAFGPVEFISLTQTFFNEFLSQIPTGTELCLASHFTSYVFSVFTKTENVSDRNRLKYKALLLISPKNIFEIRWKNIKELVRRDKEARTVERNSSVSRSERKKTITIDSDDRSNTSECDIDEQKAESEG